MLAAEGFGNRHCFLENIADKNIPPDLSQCVFVIEQALSVRALQELVTAAGSESVCIHIFHFKFFFLDSLSFVEFSVFFCVFNQWKHFVVFITNNSNARLFVFVCNFVVINKRNNIRTFGDLRCFFKFTSTDKLIDKTRHDWKISFEKKYLWTLRNQMELYKSCSNMIPYHHFFLAIIVFHQFQAPTKILHSRKLELVEWVFHKLAHFLFIKF